MANIEIVNYEPDHGAYIAQNMRLSDRREIYYLSLLSPAAAIRSCMAFSDMAYTAMADGVPFLMWGVTRRTFVSDVGNPWLLGTDEANNHQYRFGRQTLTYFAEMSSRFERMENYALAENKRALRWIKWAGFDIYETLPYGAFGAPFVRFGKGF